MSRQLELIPYTVTEYALKLSIARKSARQRLERIVRNGAGTRESVEEPVDTIRWGKRCRVSTKFTRYWIAPGAK